MYYHGNCSHLLLDRCIFPVLYSKVPKGDFLLLVEAFILIAVFSYSLRYSLNIYSWLDS
jgi:hypothetical protein